MFFFFPVILIWYDGFIALLIDNGQSCCVLNASTTTAVTVTVTGGMYHFVLGRAINLWNDSAWARLT